MASKQRPTVDELLAELWEAKGSDLLLTAGTAPRLRADGELRPVSDVTKLTPADTESMLREILTEAQRRKFELNDLDFSFTWRNLARIRGNAFRQRGSVTIALRMMPSSIPSMEDLRLPQALRDTTRLKQGLVLTTGPTGSGKSTTLASLVDWINKNRAVHVLTIEDPIEYVHWHKMAAVNQRAVGEDVATFAQALRSALREDPDVLLVGELRDLESIRSALTLAETGHLVFGTLHTNDTAQTIDRLIDVFPGDQQPQIRSQLAGVITAVVYQRLLPKIGGGQVAAFEVMVATMAVRNLIRESKINQLRGQVVTGQRDGMQTLEASLNELIAEGLVTYDDALARSTHPKEIVRARQPA
ncbi:MAG: type IV pilus twitching motility protein PilT [Actinomycetes bacterium]